MHIYKPFICAYAKHSIIGEKTVIPKHSKGANLVAVRFRVLAKFLVFENS